MSSPLEIPGAQKIVLSQIPEPLPSEKRAPLDALGFYLAKNVHAPRPHPPFPAAIKDGFAVRASDGDGEHDVVTAVRAGASAERGSELGARQAAYVTTGAPMPPGTDVVVQIESVKDIPSGNGATPESTCIALAKPPSAGSEVRAIGSDIREDEIVLRANAKIGVAEVGLLATLGCSTVEVMRRPRLGVLSTGDELLDPLSASTTASTSGRIFDCNRPLLLAAARASAVDAVDLGIARDNAAALEAALDSALSSSLDVLVCSGGVSMGDRDLVKPLLARRGTVHFGKVRMKPGKPLTFATVPRPAGAGGQQLPLLVFGLPGNPVSAFACFHLVVLPALRRLGGDPSPLPRRVRVTLASPMKMDPERPEYHRAILSIGDDGLVAHSTGGQISSRLLSCRAADALVELPAEAGTLPVGTVATALLIGTLERGAGAINDALLAALPPVLPAHPLAAVAAAAPPASVAQGSGAPATSECRVGILLVRQAGSATATGQRDARTGPLLDALALRLMPGSWLAEVSEAVAGDTLEREVRRMWDKSTGCSLVLALATEGSGAAIDDGTALWSTVVGVAERPIPAFGSLMRGACIQQSPAASLLGNWGAALHPSGGAMVLCLPGHVGAAVACVDAVLPMVGHALTQAGSGCAKPLLRG